MKALADGAQRDFRVSDGVGGEGELTGLFDHNRRDAIARVGERPALCPEPLASVARENRWLIEEVRKRPSSGDTFVDMIGVEIAIGPV